MKILGIDPGSIKVGWGLIGYDGDITYIESGMLFTVKKASIPERCGWLAGQFSILVERHRPDYAVVEETVVGMHNNIQSALKLANARGAIIGAVAAAGVPIVEVSPKHLKVTVVGYGNADKSAVTSAVIMRLGIGDIKEDEADALAAAITGAHELERINHAK